MIVRGIGTDIVELGRFESKVSNSGGKLLGRLFNQAEIDESGRGPRRLERLAGRFAAKEAVLKAMGTGLRSMSWKEVTIHLDEFGAPKVKLEGKALRISKGLGIADVLVSISHSGGYCIACAVAIGEPQAELHSDL